MALFGFGSKKPEAKGDKYYEQALKNPEKQLELLEKGANLGSTKAMVELGRYCFRYYLQNEKKEKAALRQAADWMERAEKLGGKVDEAVLGQAYELTGRQEQAAQRYLSGAQQGDGFCQYKTGRNYDAGGLFPQDDKEALFWYEKSAAQNVPGGMGGLGGLYREGRGIAQDLDKARSLLEKAAQQGDAAACGYLAWDFFHGEGGRKQSDREAAQYARQGEKEGDPRCIYVLAMLRCEGRGGMEKNYAQGLRAMHSPALEGFAPAAEGEKLCNQRRLTWQDPFFVKARAAGTREAMVEAAMEKSVPANVHFLKESADLLAAGGSLTQEQMHFYMDCYRRCQGALAHPPKEILFPLLDAVARKGMDLLKENQLQAAYRLAEDMTFDGHVGCTYVLLYVELFQNPSEETLKKLQELSQRPELQEPRYQHLAGEVMALLSYAQLQQGAYRPEVEKRVEKYRRKLEEIMEKASRSKD